jgi:hypothetical protein
LSTNSVSTKFTNYWFVYDEASSRYPNWTAGDLASSCTIGCVATQAGVVEAYRPAYMKFTTPKFNGTSKNIKIKLYIIDTNNYERVTFRVPLRYAVCKSYANRNSYRNTVSDVSDEHQIVSGVWEVKYYKAGVNFMDYTEELTIECTKLKPNTTYYLFLWGSDTPSPMYQWLRNIQPRSGSWDKHVVTVTYYENAAHIDTGSEIKTCECYIDIGDSWKPIVPYVDTGTSWSISI